MSRALRRGLWTALIGVLGMGLLAGGLLLALRPPQPLRAPQRDLVLADVTLVRPGAGRRSHQTLRVGGGRIASIADYAPATDGTPEARRYAGAVVTPGLVDLHVHHPPGALATDVQAFDLLDLDFGVTSVRDCGSFDGSVLETRAAVAAGAFAGPRIFACGPLIDGDPPFWPGAEIAHDAAEGERIVDRVAATGVDCIKAYSHLSADALRGVRDAAHRHHLTLVGHVPVSVPLEAAHIDDVQHLSGVPGLPPPSLRDELIPALLAGWDTIDAARIDAVVRTSLAQGIVYTPTLVILKRFVELASGSLPPHVPGVDVLPRYYPEIFWRPGAVTGWSVPALTPATARRIVANLREVVRRLHEAGVTLHVGTDSFNPFAPPGAALHEELREFVAAGFSAEEALAAATRGNGAALPPKGLGSLEPGAPADLLVLRQDPTRDLSALSTLEAVVADGRLYPKERLDEAVARYRDHFHGWLYDHLTLLLFPHFLAPVASRGEEER